MAIIGSIALILFLGAVFAPQFWVQHTMKRHAGERADFPGTGGELARHLLDHFNIDGVGVEETEKGDHYDPATRTVRLSKDNYAKSSLTAVAVAAHEVGHAIQHHRDESGLKRRQRMVSFAMITDKFASIFFIAAPILTVIVRSPAAFLGMVVIGIALLAIRVVVHLVTLDLAPAI